MTWKRRHYATVSATRSRKLQNESGKQPIEENQADILSNGAHNNDEEQRGQIMNRSIIKTAETVNGIDKGGYSMTIAEMDELCSLAKRGLLIEALCAAYNGGYVRGHRATLAGKYAERKKGRA